MQNISDYSGGLKIRPKSHNSFCINNFKQLIKNIFKRNSMFNLNFIHKNIQPNLNVGDLIVWNLRLHHSGASWRYKFNKNLSLKFIDTST